VVEARTHPRGWGGSQHAGYAALVELPTRLPILTRVDADRIAELREAGEFFWLDLEDPSEEELGQLGMCFDLHELAMEDVRHFGQRPKVDEYGDHAVVVYFGVAHVGSDEEYVSLLEVHIFVHGSFVVTVHREPWADRDQLCATFGVVPVGSEQLVIYRILDSLTDSFFPLVERLDREVEELEQLAVEAPRPEHAATVMALKRDLAQLRRTVGPQRDVAGTSVVRLADIPGLENGPRDYFRDVYDHMIRIDHALDATRVLLSDVLAVHMARSAQRQNDAMERLTIVSTIFLPLSFVVGFFGQNFRWMTDAIDGKSDFVVFGLGGLVVSLMFLVPVVSSSLLPRMPRFRGRHRRRRRAAVITGSEHGDAGERPASR